MWGREEAGRVRMVSCLATVDPISYQKTGERQNDIVAGYTDICQVSLGTMYAGFCAHVCLRHASGGRGTKIWHRVGITDAAIRTPESRDCQGGSCVGAT